MMLRWAVRHLVFWSALVGVVALGLDRVGVPPSSGQSYRPQSAGVASAPSVSTGPRSTTIRSGIDGHFVALADVDGTDVHFLVDTGASGVVLTPEDAERIGLHLREDDFTLSYHTAGGIVRAAPVTLRQVRIGALSLQDVDAAVNEVSMGVSLLGMSFLSRLDGYHVQGDRLILYW